MSKVLAVIVVILISPNLPVSISMILALVALGFFLYYLGKGE